MRKYLILSVAINLLAVTAFIVKRTIYKPVSRTEEIKQKSRQARIDYLNSLPLDSSDVVFVGTSLTEGFAVEELFHAKNRGVAGGRTAEIAELKICGKIVFLEVGINDLANGVSVDSAYKNFQKIVKRIKGKVVVESVPFISEGYQENFREVNQKIQAFNSLIHPDIILPSGDSLTYDGLHYNKRGYEVWGDLISSSFPVSAK